MKNKKEKILFGISSGISGYKIPSLIRNIRDCGFDADVILTANAKRMFGTEMFESAAGKKILVEIIQDGFDLKKIIKSRWIDHVRLASESALIIVAPATANIIGKIASGIADDLLTTVILAFRGPVMICPSMNPGMLRSIAVIENIKILEKRGFYIFHPVYGRLACGTEGVGRLPDVSNLKQEIIRIMGVRRNLNGVKVMVTGGASVEYIDDVRYITNRGSGKFGKEIADECVRQGACVTYVKSRSADVAGMWQNEKTFETSKDLKRIIIEESPHSDIVFHTASVGDYFPLGKRNGKPDSRENIKLDLAPVEKLINLFKRIKKNLVLVGFKAVYGLSDEIMIRDAKSKLAETGSDFIFVNDTGKENSGFSSDFNEGYLISAAGSVIRMERDLKRNIAARIISEASRLLRVSANKRKRSP